MSRVLAIQNSHNASICEINDNVIVYFQEAERLDKIKKSNKWEILLYKYKNETFDNVIFVYSYPGKFLNKDTEENVKHILNNFNIKFKEFNYEKKHHFFHACTAYFNSGFKKSYALIIDGNGDRKQNGETEIVSLYYFNKNKVKKIFKVFNVLNNERVEGKNFYINTISLGNFFEIFKNRLKYKEEGSIMARSCYEDPFTSYTSDQHYFIKKFNHFQAVQQNLSNSLCGFKFSQTYLSFKIQKELERVVLNYVKNIVKSKQRNLCVSGGVFQNTVLNSKILDVCSNLYVDPFADDSGLSMGAALWYSNNNFKKIRNLYLGDFPNYNLLNKNTGYLIEPKDVAQLICEKNIVAIYQGRNELGKRALGNRSFLYDPRDPFAKEKINLLKGREWFRPCAGTILYEYRNEWFNLKSKEDTPFMSYVFNVLKSNVPGITHVDNTCRIQTLKQSENFHYYKLIEEFYKKTNIPILLNTSFNLAGQPLVNDILDVKKTMFDAVELNFNYVYFPEIKKLYTRKCLEE